VARAGMKGHIELASGAEEVALAGLLADLIRQNLEQNPRKWNDFQRLATSVFITVTDAEVSITMAFAAGALVVHAGLHGEPRIRISTTADLLLELCMLRVVNGVLRPFHPDSRSLVEKMLKGAVKISGIPRNPVQMFRFARLMSVNG
jgi:hypothetical protein